MPIPLLVPSTVSISLFFPLSSVIGIQDAIQTTNYVIHALGASRACAGHHRKKTY
jgi:hypothetical protein